MVINPGNPTGAYLDRGERKLLLDYCESYNLPLIADEVFNDYPFPAASQSQVCLASTPQTALLSGGVKVALAGG